MSRLPRAEFFGHDKILKLSSKIAKKSKQNTNYLNIKDQELIKLLCENVEWLDYIGITIKIKDGKTITLRWEIV